MPFQVWYETSGILTTWNTDFTLEVGVAGMFVMGGGYIPGTVPQILGALAVLLASVNVAGGFILTKRMLDMFKRECLFTDPVILYWIMTLSPRPH